LAVADALDKARHFVLGCKDLTIAVDHKPLVKIFGDRALDNIHNARIRNLKERTLKYRFTIIHIPGVRNKTSDALSRHPTGPPHPPTMILPDDVLEVTTHRPSPTIPTSLMAGVLRDEPNHSEDRDQEIQGTLAAALTSSQPITWEQVKAATASDQTLTSLMDQIEAGFPEKKSSCPVDMQEFHAHHNEL
jgi:thiamine pyrophosphate-dependent acetolactate synthase large subunit-like protein